MRTAMSPSLQNAVVLGLVLAVSALPILAPPAHADVVPPPLQQARDGVAFDAIQCSDDKVLMQSPGGTPACVNESSTGKLVAWGWNAVAALHADPKTARDGNACKDMQEINAGKFDHGLLDRINEMLDARVTGSYSVLLTVYDADKQAVGQILTDCHGAEDVAAAKSLSFVTASVPLEEIPSLSAYHQVQSIGAGELFEIPVVLDNVEGTTWVQIDPVQCGGNPWGDARSSPDVIKEHFAGQDVDVFDVKTEQTHQVTCEACYCPDGITLYLQVSHDDVRTMLNLGFSLPDKQPDAPRKPNVSNADTDNPSDRPFVTTWRIASPDESITIPVGGATGTYTVDWGDGSVSANVTGDQSHAYADAGEYAVSISGNFTRVLLGEDRDNAGKLASIDQWGDTRWESMASAFRGTVFQDNTTDAPDLFMVADMSEMFAGTSSFNRDSPRGLWRDIDMSEMFAGTSSFNGDVSDWNVSSVTDMSGMFSGVSSFNGNVSSWDVSSVTDMSSMFASSTFNGDVSSWDVSSVTDMSSMFVRSGFNGDISQWDVSSVTDMRHMFASSAFNGDVSSWDVSSVTDMSYMFQDTLFNDNISDWNVSSVTDMSSMFHDSKFNGDISNWDVSGVAYMHIMFAKSSFNNDISRWDVSGVTDMHAMLAESSFNNDISRWDVSGVTDMNHMFENSSFNGDVSNWDVSDVEYMGNMFDGASSFNQNLGGWYIVLDSPAIDDITGIVGMLSAQNRYLGSQVLEYNIGSGGDSDYFEIVDGIVLKVKDAANIQEKPSYSVNVTSAGGYGTGNFRVLEVTGVG